MKYLLSFCVLCVIIGTLMPVVVSAQESGQVLLYENCPLDGYVTAEISDTPIEVVEAANQPLVFSFDVINGSNNYSYGGLSVGVGLYVDPTDVHPMYWAAVADAVALSPTQRQVFAVALDASLVDAGQYDLRVGVAQGRQLSALSAGQTGEGISVTKSADATPFSFTLNAQPDSEPIVAGTVQYTLTAENTTDSVLRDYDQTVAIVRGSAPVGSAVVSVAGKQVKMIPGSSEVTNSTHQIQTPGEYTVIGFSDRPNVLMPVTTQEFTVGTGSGPDDVFITSTGIAGLDSDESQVSVAACVSSIAGASGDGVQIQQVVERDEGPAQVHSGDVDTFGGMTVTLDKTDVVDGVVVTNMYAQQAGAAVDTQTNDVHGVLLHSIAQTVACDQGCDGALSPSTTTPVQQSQNRAVPSWVYVLGLLAVAGGAYFIIAHQLKTKPKPAKNKDGLEMHQPEEQ